MSNIPLPENAHAEGRRRWISERERHLLSECEGDPARVREYGTEAVGLALSGGGIRSASFCLGVLQALVQYGWLRHIDYLSTVSGGGYIGTALTWYLRHDGYGTDDSDFPFETGYGLNRPGGKDDQDHGKDGADEAAATGETGTPGGGQPADASPVSEPDPERLRPLRSLRHRARLHTPGDGLDAGALAAVVARAVGSSVMVCVAGLVILALFLRLEIRLPLPEPLDFAIPGVLFQQVQPIWSLWLAGTVRLPELPGALWTAIHCLAALPIIWLLRSRKTDTVCNRRWDIGEGWIVKSALVLGVLGSLPLVARWEALTVPGGIASVVTGVSGALSLYRHSVTGEIGVWSRRLIAPVSAAALLYGMAFLAFWLSDPDSYGALGAQGAWPVLAWMVPLAVLFVGWFVLDLNQVSLHRFYRDRLDEAFLPPLDPSPSDARRLGAKEWSLPYHLINTHVVRPAEAESKTRSDDIEAKKVRDRGGDSFLLSSLWCGSGTTGWSKTEEGIGSEMDLATAMAASGAAAHPSTGAGGAGPTRGRLVSVLMGVLNLRMGYWCRDPRMQVSEAVKASEDLDREPGLARHAFGKLKGIFKRRGKAGMFTLSSPPTFKDLIREAVKRVIRRFKGWLGRKVLAPLLLRPNLLWPGLRSVAFPCFRQMLDQYSPWYELSDGAHFENLGVYELIRRRSKVIIACDAGADPRYEFADLANLVEKVRADFGTVIHISPRDLDILVPRDGDSDGDRSGRADHAQRGYLLAHIDYSPHTSDEAPDEGGSSTPLGDNVGVLVYLKSTFFERTEKLGLSPDVYGYRLANPTFPHESTVDQFFDERQFEAYRELGFLNAHNMLHTFEKADEKISADGSGQRRWIESCGAGGEDASPAYSESELRRIVLAVLKARQDAE